ncbi:GNAT family N-acetyltransferase [Alteromonas sp. 345S023]|uniref:GNAT family N-acetyltransferase n=1 Tax=Alteromonas profundi TaxID=2696062 RepID=A0A7X5LM32_9ALTE|nr:GNAT family N-acetyltransferase [Alteromonas profundi]NDV91858.1 GNAT family N-acetyltransferase [Alteromonas profundi]
MAQNSVYSWLYSPFVNAKQRITHRRLLVIADDEAACANKVAQLLAPPSKFNQGEQSVSTIVVGAEGTLQANVRKHLLGNEYDIGVLYCHRGFSPSDLLALAGTLRYGGCLILCTPPFKQWINTPSMAKVSYGYQQTYSRYIARLTNIFIETHEVSMWTPTRLHLAPPETTSWTPTHCHPSTAGAPTQSLEGESDIPLKNQTVEKSIEKDTQKNIRIGRRQETLGAFNADELVGVQEVGESVGVQGLTDKMGVQEVGENVGVQGLNKEQRTAFNDFVAMQCLRGILTAPRGRGKSTLLGVIAAYFVSQGKTVYITSTVRRNVDALIKHCCGAFTTIKQKGKNSYFDPKTGGVCSWLATDNPKLFYGQCDLLIVDEAASLPLPTIKTCLSHHPQWLLATTLQGYEGSGQGFIHRLLPSLLAKNALHRTLTAPYRWVTGDKLEILLNHLCLFEGYSFNNDLVSSLVDRVSVDEKYSKLSRVTKCDLDTMPYGELNEAMGLLALAHYQTTPDDFLRILDSEALLLFVYKENGRIVGAAVIYNEGGEQLAPLAHEVAEGSRRPAGHMSAQRIALLAGDGSFAKQKYWRINRIAVHPWFRNQGIGTQIIEEIKQFAHHHNIDCLTSSYGAKPALNRFWHNNGFVTIDTGIKVNKASGDISALVIYPLSKEFNEKANLLTSLYANNNNSNVFKLTELDKRVQKVYLAKLWNFCHGHLSLEQVTMPLASFCKLLFANDIDKNELQPLLCTLPLNTSELRKVFKASGKSDLNDKIRNWLIRNLPKS